jgi:hypothetical protein
MSVSPIVLRGYGAWSNVNKLPTRGYGTGSVAAADPSEGWVARQMSRSVVSPEISRVVVAYPERR